MASIEDLRGRLLARRNELLAQGAGIDEDLLFLETNRDSELEEEAQEDTLARLLAQFDERSRAEIAAIDHAMTRIAQGDYGRCASCGDPIAVERLEVLPTAVLCIACAEERELRHRRAS